MSNDASHPYRNALGQLSWQQLAPGLRQKIHQTDGQCVRIVEYDREYHESSWCSRGHVGYVLSGQMQVEFDGGVTTFRAGDAILIPDGKAHQHRHHATIETTTLFLVEQMEARED